MSETMPFRPAKLPLWRRLLLLRGRARRWFLNHFRREYVQQQLAKRQGECRRCGACCQMGIRCWKLSYGDGQSHCQSYNGRRSLNCRNFPIDERDLDERDLVAPDTPCGYHFNGAAPATDQRD
jgi:hypothetical protein